jgi:hypothetical protein
MLIANLVWEPGTISTLIYERVWMSHNSLITERDSPLLVILDWAAVGQFVAPPTHGE